MAKYDHDALVLRACRWLRGPKRCRPVLAEFQHRNSDEIPDAIGWTATGFVHVVEAKVSLADFRKDAKKGHHQRGSSMGHARWYVAPRGLLSVADLGGAGLLEPSGRGLRVARRAVVRTMGHAAIGAAHSILRNALIRHELGVEWRPDVFRFAPLETS